ncbi:MAG: hypothetical protein FJY10_05890 [Bacteroidetes bacterium]|nr:hypothetical protein [Bacteroidota bacterium]
MNLNPVVKNIFAIILGVIFGSVVNMGIIMLSGSVIPPPEGADVTSAEGLKMSMHLFEPKHFLFPFLAHALGTFLGALLTALVAATHKLKLSMVVGALFLIGGMYNVFILPSPFWFTILDLVVAYLPMAFLAAKLVTRK